MNAIFIPLRAKSKPRPRVTIKGTYMPPSYMDWRKDFGKLVRALRIPKFDGNVKLALIFETDGVWVKVEPIDNERPKHVRADIDNLIGGVMEVLQDTQVVTDDRNVVQVVAKMGGTT